MIIFFLMGGLFFLHYALMVVYSVFFKKNLPLTTLLINILKILPVFLVIYLIILFYNDTIIQLLDPIEATPFIYVGCFSFIIMLLLSILMFIDYKSVNSGKKALDFKIGINLIIYAYTVSFVLSTAIVFFFNFYYSSKPEENIVTVTDKMFHAGSNSGKRSYPDTYVIYHTPDIGGLSHFSVPKNLYDKVQKEDKFNFFIQKGFFSIPYINKRVYISKKAETASKINELVKSILVNMVECPTGSLKKPYREISFTKPFYIGKYEVTQKEFQIVMGNNPSTYKGGNLPVNKVSYSTAKEFCNKLNISKSIPKGYKFELPTENEWEYAALANTNSNDNKSDDAKSSINNLDDVAWYSNNSDNKLHPVGLKKPNAWGIYDMQGNVSEWCDMTVFSIGGSFRDDSKKCSFNDLESDTSLSVDYCDEKNGFRLALIPLYHPRNVK